MKGKTQWWLQKMHVGETSTHAVETYLVEPTQKLPRKWEGYEEAMMSDTVVLWKGKKLSERELDRIIG